MVLGHITESQERLINRKVARETVGEQRFLRGIAASDVEAGSLRRLGVCSGQVFGHPGELLDAKALFGDKCEAEGPLQVPVCRQ